MNVGVALYAWTGVIGAVLAGLAVGNLIAAHRVDAGGRDGAEDQIRRAAIAAGLTAVAVTIVLTAEPIVRALATVPRVSRLAIVVALIGFVPAAMLGLAAPPLARLATLTLASAGRRLGAIGAATTAGGLVGTWATGVVLIPCLGTRGAALVWALMLVAVVARRSESRGAAVILAGCVALAAFIPRGCLVESAYQCLRVDEETMLDGQRVRVLYLDGLPHAHVAVDDPMALVHDYLAPAAEVAAYLRPVGGPPPAVLIIGGGGYSLARYFAAIYPGAIVDVIEIDPAVTAVARDRLGLRADAPISIHHGDARSVIGELPAARRYDVIVLDAFADVVVPYQLVTAEFDAIVRERLTPDGTYVALVHDSADRGRLMPAAFRTMSSVFGSADVLASGPGVRWNSPVSRTWSVVGSRTPIDPARLRATRRYTANGPFPTLSEVAPPAARERWIAAPGPRILTDDYAPVEQLGALLFE